MTDPKAAERQPFLKAIAATPDDDLPRLVYADWLDETGDDLDARHAWLIRWMCQPGRRDGLISHRSGVDRGTVTSHRLQFRKCGVFMNRLHAACGHPTRTIWTRGFLAVVHISDREVIRTEAINRLSAGTARVMLLTQSERDFHQMMSVHLTERFTEEIRTDQMAYTFQNVLQLQIRRIASRLIVPPELLGDGR